MRKLVASELVSVDGVVESPEQWQLPYFDDEMRQEIEAAIAASDAILLGRMTYEEWAAYFPEQPRPPFCGLHKQHPQVRRLDDPRRAPRVEQLDADKGDLVEEVTKLKRQPARTSGSLAAPRSSGRCWPRTSSTSSG